MPSGGIGKLADTKAVILKLVFIEKVLFGWYPHPLQFFLHQCCETGNPLIHTVLPLYLQGTAVCSADTATES